MKDRAVSLSAVKDILKMANMEEFDIVAYHHIMQLPPVTPKIGHWILLVHELYACSKCHSKWTRKLNYCPNCGCAMIEPQESEEV